MDPRVLREHLAEAEAQAAKGLEHIAHQRTIIADLDRDGHDSRTANELLTALLRSQALHEQHRDRLKRELGLS